jgi:hypothetical protein
MIVGVVQLASTTGDNAPGSSMFYAWSRHGVLTVVAPLALRQQAFEIHEHRPIALVNERSARANALNGCPSLWREVRKSDNRSGWLSRMRLPRDADADQRSDEGEHSRKRERGPGAA